jgi:hypothetical protein
MKHRFVSLILVLAASAGLAAELVPSRMVSHTNGIPNLSTNRNVELILRDVNAKWPVNINPALVYVDTNFLAGFGYATTGAVQQATGALAAATASSLAARMPGTNLADATYTALNQTWNINWGGKTGVWQVIEYAVYTNPVAMTKYTNSAFTVLNTASNWVLQSGNQNGNLSLTDGGSQLVVPARTVAIMYTAGTVFTKWTNSVDVTAYLIRGSGTSVGTVFAHDKEADDYGDPIIKRWSSVNGMVMCRPTAADRKYSLRASLWAEAHSTNTIQKMGVAWKQWQIMLFQLNTDDPAE